MRLYFDLDLDYFVLGPGTQAARTNFDFKRGDDADTIDLSFVQDNVVVSLPSGATGKFGLKEDGKFLGGFVVSASSWTKTGTGEDTIYSFAPNFNTTQLNDLLIDGDIVDRVADEAARFSLTGLSVGAIVYQEDEGSYWAVIDAAELNNAAGWDYAPTKDDVSLFGEFQWIVDGKRRSSPTFETIVSNDIIKDDEGLPTDGDPGYYNSGEVDALLDFKADLDTTTEGIQAAHAAQIAGQSIYFDGTAGASFTPTATASSPISLFAWIGTTSTGTQVVTGGSGSPQLAITNSGADLRLAKEGTGTLATFSGVIASGRNRYAVTINGTAAICYRNGYQVATSTITATSFSQLTRLGCDGSDANPLTGEVALPILLNYEASSVKVEADYNRNGVVDPIDRGGSMTSIITGAASDFSSDSGFWTKENSATISGGSANFVGTDSRLRRNDILTPGRRYRLTFTISAFVSGSPYVIDGSGTPLGTITASNGTKTIEFTTAKYTNAEHLLIGNFVGSIDDLTLIPLGALVAIDRADRHAGFQIADVSGNGHHLNLPAAGVSIVSPARRGQLIYKATTSGWQQAGRIDPTAIIESIMARTQGDTTEIAVGNANGDANIVDSILSSDTDWRSEELLVRQSSTGQLWVYNDEVFPTDFLINFVLP